MALKVGDKAPAFSGLDQEGKEISLAAFKGKKLVLYFYPKDDTPGCTKEACSLRDAYPRFQQEGFEIVGVSPDKVEKHKKFEDKYDLPFKLLADTEHKALNAYGAWGRKKFMGKEYDGVLRKTFVINEQGKIERIIEKVRTKDHAVQLLDEQKP